MSSPEQLKHPEPRTIIVTQMDEAPVTIPISPMAAAVARFSQPISAESEKALKGETTVHQMIMTADAIKAGTPVDEVDPRIKNFYSYNLEKRGPSPEPKGKLKRRALQLGTGAVLAATIAATPVGDRVMDVVKGVGNSAKNTLLTPDKKFIEQDTQWQSRAIKVQMDEGMPEKIKVAVKGDAAEAAVREATDTITVGDQIRNGKQEKP